MKSSDIGTVAFSIEASGSTASTTTVLAIATTTSAGSSNPCKWSLTCSFYKCSLTTPLSTRTATLTSVIKASLPILRQESLATPCKMATDESDIPSYPLCNTSPLIGFTSGFTCIKGYVFSLTAVVAVKWNLEGQEGVTGISPRP